MASNIRGLNYDLTRDRPCVSARASIDYDRRKAERNLDCDIAADKPCVSLPGQKTTAWRRDPEVYLEYSDQYAVTQRPGRGERLITAEDRDELPYCRAKKEKKEDGAFAKPLVGYRNYQGRQPTAAREEMSRISTAASERERRKRELRSSYREFRGTEPVVLNRTLGYDGADVSRSPQTPHGNTMTDITNYALEKWVDLYPDVPSVRMDTGQKLEQRKRLLVRKALQGAPNMGKSLVPQLPVPDDVEIRLIEKPPMNERVRPPGLVGPQYFETETLIFFVGAHCAIRLEAGESQGWQARSCPTQARTEENSEARG